VSLEPASIAIRALGFICLFQAAGAAFFLRLFQRHIAAVEQRIGRVARATAVGGIGLVIAHQALEAALLRGDVSGLIDPRLQQLAWSSSSGNAALLEILALAIVVLGLRRPGRDGAIIASTGAAVAVCAFALTGHTSASGYRGLLAPLLIVHLLAIAFWFGALLPLSLMLRSAPRTDTVALLREFSALAGVLVPLIALAGLTLALTLIHPTRAWRAPYGLLILLKIALFSALMGLAAWNRWRLLPRLGARAAAPEALPAGSRTAAVALRGSIAAEYVMIVIVFAVTASLTALFSP
jgi:putative copper export protein